MKFHKVLLFLLFSITISCSKAPIKDLAIKEKNLDLQVLEAYEEGKKSLEAGDVLYAAKKFNEAEILFPQSEFAKSALMAAYSYYTQDYYGDAIAELKDYKTYPFHKDLDYAYYLLAFHIMNKLLMRKKIYNLL